MSNQPDMPDSSSSFFKQLEKKLKSDDVKLPLYLGIGLIALFLITSSLAPQLSQKLGTLSAKKQSQTGLAAGLDFDNDGFTDEVEQHVGTDFQKDCGVASWPPDFNDDAIVDDLDLDSFTTPIRHINTSAGDVGYDVRWDVVPGKGIFSTDINIQDLTAVSLLKGKTCTSASPTPTPPVTPSPTPSLAPTPSPTPPADEGESLLEPNQPSQGAAAQVLSPPCDSFGDVDLDGDVDNSDVLKISRFVDGLETFTDEQKRRANVDGNRDGSSNHVINSTDWIMVNMYLTGLRLTFPMCVDHDTDGFVDGVENYLGTDPYKSCEGSFAWPPNFNNDRFVDITDIGRVAAAFGKTATGSNRRLDLNTDGFIDITDKGAVAKYFGKACTISSPPAVSLSASGPTSPNYFAGQTITLSWSTTGAVWPCSTTGDWGVREVATSGAENWTLSVAKTYTFSLSCYGPGGSTFASVTIVAQQPCSGRPVLKINGVTSGEVAAMPNSQVTFEASGLSNCQNIDKIEFRTAIDSPNFNTVLASCTLDNSTSCSTVYTVNLAPGGYSIIAYLDIGSDGTFEWWSEPNILSLRVSSDLVFEAEGPAMFHAIGRLDSDGWSAATAFDPAGHLIYGPYTTGVSPGSHAAFFRMMIDNNSADNLRVVHLDVYDATTNTVLAARDITRQYFSAAWTYQDFALAFTSTLGHKLEFRIWWDGAAYVRVDKVTVTDAPPAAQTVPAGWPVTGEVGTLGVGGPLHTDSIGEAIDIGFRDNPIEKSFGSPLYATCDGSVITGYYDTLGFWVKITCDDAAQVVRYGHMNSIGVSDGQHVLFRQPIGTLGQTGNATGPHVHYSHNDGGLWPPYVPFRAFAGDEIDSLDDTDAACNLARCD